MTCERGTSGKSNKCLLSDRAVFGRCGCKRRRVSRRRPSSHKPVLHLSPKVVGASERARIITPFCANTFESELRRHNLLHKYPSLPDNLRNGFRIGSFPRLPFSITPQNHSSSFEHFDFISTYIHEQVTIGRMSGPFSREELEVLFDGPFISSPLSVVAKAGDPAKLRLVQNCSFPAFDGFSVNDFIDAADFPTTWGTASVVAQIVRGLIFCFPA